MNTVDMRLFLCSITREDLGPYKLKVTVIPAVYFVTIIIVDFIMYSVRGRSAFNVADFDSGGGEVDLALSSWERLLLVICAVCHVGRPASSPVTATACRALTFTLFTLSSRCHRADILGHLISAKR